MYVDLKKCLLLLSCSALRNCCKGNESELSNKIQVWLYSEDMSTELKIQLLMLISNYFSTKVFVLFCFMQM